MRNLWQEFKAFAMSGNVLDLALGFLIGAAFASLVQSLANNAHAAGRRRRWSARLHRAEVQPARRAHQIRRSSPTWSTFILAAVMFVVIKLIVRIGIAKTRNFGGDAQCPYCHESVSARRSPARRVGMTSSMRCRIW
jgi:large conductance mechanosensitive channel